MKLSRHPRSALWFLPFALLFALQVVPRFTSDSLTNDEPMEITNGYFYLTHGDVVSHSRHPLLSKALAALPLLALHLKEPPASTDAIDQAYTFFFKENRDRLPAMTGWGRFSSLLFGLGIGWLLFLLTRSGPLPVLGGALGLWAFDPTLSAFSGLALADVPVSFFFLASVLAFKGSLEKGTWKSAFTAGVLSAMAVTCKFSALVLLPVFGILEGAFLYGLSRAKRAGESGWKIAAIRWLVGFGGFGLWVFLLYMPGTLRLPEHLSPFRYFAQGFWDMAGYKDHPVYFMGQAGRQNHWTYYPTAFLLKSPLPFLALLAAGLGLAALRKIRFPAWQWVPGALFFAAIIPVQDLGVRYLLPAYPFFILMAAQAAGWLWERASQGAAWKILLAGMALFQAASVGLNFPHSISYFNELAPSERKFFWLGDSNLDIGQDLGRLAQTARQRGWKEVKLAYFGGVDPAAYGLAWEPWRERDLTGPRPGSVYAVNVSFFQLAPVFYPQTLPIADGWLSEERPSGRINDTWYYFEIPGTSSGKEGDFLDSAPFLQHRGYAPGPARQSPPGSPSQSDEGLSP